MYLFQLIYYSKTNADALHGNFTDAVRTILDTSRRNNPKLGVTGALLFNENYFVQVLEGDRKSVTETFCRIAQDPRHSDIVILEARPVSERRFLDWSMAFVGQSDVAQRLYTKYSPATDSFQPSKMSADSVLAFVMELVRLEEHVATTAEKPPRKFRAEQTRATLHQPPDLAAKLLAS